MKHEENHASNLKIAYIGGGSRGWARMLMGDLALEGQLSGAVYLYDIDYEAASNNEKIGNMHSQHPDSKGKWVYKAAKTLEEALDGADFVIMSILPGTFKEMASDVHEPERYGIYQSVGDTTGPGGLVRALRTIPIYTGFAEAVRKYCSDAWVINYTNPMTLCTRALYAAFPEIKAFGCCHEVFGVQKLLAEMLEDMEGIKDAAREEIRTNVLGINHFTWFDRASYRDKDLLPLFKAFAEKYYLSGFEGKNEGNWLNSFFASANRVKFDL